MIDDVPAQSFGGAYRGSVCIHRGECMRVMDVCAMFLKKNLAYTSTKPINCAGSQQAMGAGFPTGTY